MISTEILADNMNVDIDSSSIVVDINVKEAAENISVAIQSEEISFAIAEPESIDVEIDTSTLDVDVGIGIVIQYEGEPYEGEYTVTPKVYSSVQLPTAGTTPIADITVLKIPQNEAHNLSGGITLTIGNDSLS